MKFTPKSKRRMLLISVIIIVILSAGLFMFAPRTYNIPDVPTIQDDSYRLMTYNLRYSSSDYDEWYERRDEIVTLIEDYEPDSIGMQEADWGWMDFLPFGFQIHQMNHPKDGMQFAEEYALMLF